MSPALIESLTDYLDPLFGFIGGAIGPILLMLACWVWGK